MWVSHKLRIPCSHLLFENVPIVALQFFREVFTEDLAMPRGRLHRLVFHVLPLPSTDDIEVYKISKFGSELGLPIEIGLRAATRSRILP